VSTVRVVLIFLGVCLASTSCSAGQVHERFEGWCDKLQTESPSDLVQFLSGAVPDENNARCVTWAIHRLGEERYEPAIATLVKFLGFRQPQTEMEKLYHGLEIPFPARVALEEMGKKALPDVLLAIEADSTSSTARDNAVAVWIEIYKYERPKGIAALKQEEIKADNAAIKGRLASAIRKALPYCSVQDEAACREAAQEDP